MGDYAARTDIEARFVGDTLAQLTAASGTTPDAGKIATAIADAEVEVNASLATQYETPVNLTLHPDLADWLKGLTVPLAIESLYALRSIDMPTAKIAATEARKRLAALVQGEAKPPGATTPTSTASAGPGDSWGFEPLKSGRDNMAGL